jgi:hypothetical protein
MSNFTATINQEGEGLLSYVTDEGDLIVVRTSDPGYADILAALLRGETPDLDAIALSDEEVVAEVARVAATLSPRVSINEKGEVTFDSEPVHGAWAAAVVRYYDEGRAIDGLVRFYERLAANPSEHSREQLWNWIESQGLSVTPDGLILGYKALANKGDVFTSKSGGTNTVYVNGEPHTGKIPQGVGDVVWMDRPEVDDDYSRACSVGLHVGSHNYISWFASGSDVVTKVSVDPADVVSVPNSETDKMRVARYTVLDIAVPEVDDLSDHEAEALAADIETNPEFAGVREAVPESWWEKLTARLSPGRKRREVRTATPNVDWEAFKAAQAERVADALYDQDDEPIDWDEGDDPDVDDDPEEWGERPEDYWLDDTSDEDASRN